MEKQDTLKLTPPVLQPEITEKTYERAVTANSGSCLVADAIKEQYPQFSRVAVDVATISVTDRERGVRFIYLTPAPVQEALLFFDQGLREETLPRKFVIRQVAKIVPIMRSASDVKKKAAKHLARRNALEAKEQSGEVLTSDEKRTLTRLQNRKEPSVRPTSYGPGTVVEGTDEGIVRLGHPGTSVQKLERNPNLLAGRNRHFGAKTAVPSEVYKKQLEADVKAEVEKAREEIKARYEAELKRIKDGAKRKGKKSA